MCINSGACTKFQNPSQCKYYIQKSINQSKIKLIKSNYFQINVGEHLGNLQFRKRMKLFKMLK